MSALQPDPDSTVAPATSTSDADEPERYRPVIDAAIRAFQARDLEAAQRLFAEAHVLSPSARTYRGLGVVALEGGRYVEARTQLNAALESDVKPLDDDLRETTRELLAQAEVHIGSLHVLVVPVGATLFVDGAPVGDGGGPLILEEGEHSLRIERVGYQSDARIVSLVGGKQTSIHVSLSPVRVQLNPTSDKGAPPPRRGWRRNPWLWTSVGLLVAGGATALAVAFAPHDKPLEGGSTGVVVGR